LDSGHVKRRLAAILVADAVGYSRLMGLDDEGTHTRLQSHLNEFIEPKVKECGGRVVKTTGDGVLAVFESAVNAVRCGVEIQQGMANRKSEGDPDRDIQFRIGVNVGDVIVDGNEIYGDGVNVAVRLEGLAKPGKVYVSEAVYEHLRGYSQFDFIDLGDHRLKNIQRPVSVFQVQFCQQGDQRHSQPSKDVAGRQRPRPLIPRGLWPKIVMLGVILVGITTGGLTISSRFWQEGDGAKERASIIVLPFTNLSADRGEDYFADAVTEDVTTDLSQLPDIFVTARGTAFTYKDKAFDLRQLGRDLDVRYVLEGSVRKVGNAVQTNAQLVEAKSGVHVWADRFDTDIADLVELENFITGRIATSLGIELVRVEARHPQENGRNPDAVEWRMRGLALIVQSTTPEHTLQARSFFEKAVQLDPGAADAWSWLATMLVSDYLNRWNGAGTDELRRAKEAVHHAISIDPRLAQTYLALGFIHRAEGEHQAALTAFDQALALNPNFAFAYTQKANELINVGRPGEAPKLVQKAIALSPRDPFLGAFYWTVGRAYFFTREYEKAIGWLERSVNVQPNLTYNKLFLISAYALVGRQAEAQKAFANFSLRYPDYTVERIQANDRDVPNDNEVVLAALRERDQALRKAGMPEK
jgi:adenylate cyclase